MWYCGFKAVSEWDKESKKYQEKLEQIREGEKEKEQISTEGRSAQKTSSCLLNWWSRLQRGDFVQKPSGGSL